MSNTLLTPTMVTREALRVLHEKLTCIRTVNRQYDDRFARTGAKIGTSLQIRKPPQYTVRTGAGISVQNATETYDTLTVSTQKGVDISFSSVELTMEIDDFSKRFITPAMAVLASNIEADFLSTMTKGVYNLVGTAGTPGTDLTNSTAARKKLNQSLAPQDGKRVVQLGSTAEASLVNGLKGLFHSADAIKEQYTEGMMGRTSGFDFYTNERVYTHTNGSDVSGATINANVSDGDTAFTVTGLSSAPTQGTVFTSDATYAVHPETKVAYSHLQQWVVGASATTTNLPITPTPYATGAFQNVDALPTSTDALVFVGSASVGYAQNLAYHPDFATIAFADLEMPQGVDFAAREVYDNISLRIVRAYDINNDLFPCRLDVLYGHTLLYPQLACRITD